MTDPTPIRRPLTLPADTPARSPLTDDERAYLRRCVGVACHAAWADEHIDHAVAEWDNYSGRLRDLGKIGMLAWSEIQVRANPNARRIRLSELLR